MSAATAHAPIVAQGLRALAAPIRRMRRCMTVLLRWSGWDGGRAGSGAVSHRARRERRGRPPADGQALRREAGRARPPARAVPPMRRSPHPPGGG
jgi:hypothetical protein